MCTPSPPALPASPPPHLPASFLVFILVQVTVVSLCLSASLFSSQRRCSLRRGRAGFLSVPRRTPVPQAMALGSPRAVRGRGGGLSRSRAEHILRRPPQHAAPAFDALSFAPWSHRMPSRATKGSRAHRAWPKVLPAQCVREGGGGSRDEKIAKKKTPPIHKPPRCYVQKIANCLYKKDISCGHVQM